MRQECDIGPWTLSRVHAQLVDGSVGVFRAGIDRTNDELDPLGVDRLTQFYMLWPRLVLQRHLDAVAGGEAKLDVLNPAVLGEDVGGLVIAVSNGQTAYGARRVELEHDEFAETLTAVPFDPSRPVVTVGKIARSIDVALGRGEHRACAECRIAGAAAVLVRRMGTL